MCTVYTCTCRVFVVHKYMYMYVYLYIIVTCTFSVALMDVHVHVLHVQCTCIHAWTYVSCFTCIHVPFFFPLPSLFLPPLRSLLVILRKWPVFHLNLNSYYASILPHYILMFEWWVRTAISSHVVFMSLCCTCRGFTRTCTCTSYMHDNCYYDAILSGKRTCAVLAWVVPTSYPIPRIYMKLSRMEPCILCTIMSWMNMLIAGTVKS